MPRAQQGAYMLKFLKHNPKLKTRQLAETLIDNECKDGLVSSICYSWYMDLIITHFNFTEISRLYFSHLNVENILRPFSIFISVAWLLIYVILKDTSRRRCCESAALNIPANLENSAVPTGLEKVFIPIPKKGNAKGCSNYCTTERISHASKVMFKTVQARLHLYVNLELLDVQAGFRKGRGTRVQTANMHWIIEEAREFQKNICFWFLWLHQSLWLCQSQLTVDSLPLHHLA